MSCEGVLKNRENRLKNENYPPIYGVDTSTASEKFEPLIKPES